MMSDNQEFYSVLVSALMVLMLAACQQSIEPISMRKAGIRIPLINSFYNIK